MSVIEQDIASEITYIFKSEVEISGSSISKEKVQLVELPKITISTLDFKNTLSTPLSFSHSQKNISQKTCATR